MDNAKLLQLNRTKELVRPYLPQYVSMHRMGYRTGKNFSCLHPEHADETASCGIIPANPELFHCFSEGHVGDIFLAAHYLEDKPISGPGFWTENVFYLAQLFGVPVPDIELSPEERFVMEAYGAYRRASDYLLAHKRETLSDLVQAKLADYGWQASTLKDLRIGAIPSRQKYLDYLIRECGYSYEFLRKVDLHSEKIFQPDRLLFTICDSHGQPCGFSARNLAYESQQAEFEAWVETEQPEKEALRTRKEQLLPKFINTSSECPIYQKGKLLYGLHVARRHVQPGQPIEVIEGNGDVATCYDQGLRHIVGACGTIFTAEHIDLILDLGFRYIIFTLDGDQAGDKGVKRFAELIEQKCANQVGLKIEIRIIPPDYDDPDKMIRTYGVDAYLNLDKMDIFAWRLQYAIRQGEDPDQLYDRMIGLIVNEKEFTKRHRKAEALAKACGFLFEGVWKDLDDRINDLSQAFEQETRALSREAIRQLEKDALQLPQVLFTMQGQVERLSRMKNGHDQAAILSHFEAACEKDDTNLDPMGFKTGYPLFDRLFGGIPKSEAFITLPGKPNHGKSTWLINLIIGVLMNNPDLIVFCHTIDDSFRKYLSRMYGAMFRIPSHMFQAAGHHLRENTQVYMNDALESMDFGQALHMGRTFIRSLIKEGRLVLMDSQLLPKTIAAVDWKLRELRKQNPTTPIFTALDNFHKYELPSNKDANRAERECSDQLKDMTARYSTSIIATMEMPKGALRPGERPRGSAIKGNGGILYDASVNMGFYNDYRDMRDKAVLLRTKPHPRTGELITLPVVEIVIDKSKEGNGYDGEFYYELDQKSGQMSEPDESEQKHYRRLSIEQQESMQERGSKKDKGVDPNDPARFRQGPAIDPNTYGVPTLANQARNF